MTAKQKRYAGNIMKFIGVALLSCATGIFAAGVAVQKYHSAQQSTQAVIAANCKAIKSNNARDDKQDDTIHKAEIDRAKDKTKLDLVHQDLKEVQQDIKTLLSRGR